MLKKVYVWELPVRMTHWINVISLIVLAFSGFYIGRTFLHPTSSGPYTMGWMRFIHFTAAYVFVVSCAVRVYWAFAGNRYAGWNAFNIFSPQKMKELGGLTKFYLFLKKDHQPVIGHSACATYVYSGLFFLYWLEVFSGFALYSLSHAHSILWTLLGGWLFFLFEAQTIRLWHHLLMWPIVAFAIGHVYLSVYLDTKEASGILASIFSGYKTVDESYK